MHATKRKEGTRAAAGLMRAIPKLKLVWEGGRLGAYYCRLFFFC